MGHIFGRHTRANNPVVVGGEGCYLIDSTGKRYLDGSGGRQRSRAWAIATLQ